MFTVDRRSMRELFTALSTGMYPRGAVRTVVLVCAETESRVTWQCRMHPGKENYVGLLSAATAPITAAGRFSPRCDSLSGCYDGRIASTRQHLRGGEASQLVAVSLWWYLVGSVRPRPAVFLSTTSRVLAGKHTRYRSAARGVDYAHDQNRRHDRRSRVNWMPGLVAGGRLC